MRRRINWKGPALALLLLALQSWGCSSIPDDTVALVNGKAVTVAEVDAKVRVLHSQFGNAAPMTREGKEEIRRAVIESIIDRKLMLAEAELRRLLPSEDELDSETDEIKGELQDKEFETVLAEAGLNLESWRRTVAEDLAMEKLQEDIFRSRVEVGDDEVSSYLRRHRKRYEHPEQIRASQILVKTREEALQARKRIVAGEPFAQVAREISLSPDAEQGGDLGYFSRGQMPQEFDVVVFSMPRDKLSKVVETTYGHHLFLITDRKPSKLKTEDEIKEMVRRELALEKGEQAFKIWFKDLRAGADIRYNEKLIPRNRAKDGE